MQTYNRPKVVFTHGQGCVLYDTDGAWALPRFPCAACTPSALTCWLGPTDKAYLDFTAGIAVNALGHSDKGWQSALSAQAALLCHVSNLYLSAPGAHLARTLVESSFADRVFFSNSGTEANEAAIKFTRKYQARPAALTRTHPPHAPPPRSASSGTRSRPASGCGCPGRSRRPASSLSPTASTGAQWARWRSPGRRGGARVRLRTDS